MCLSNVGKMCVKICFTIRYCLFVVFIIGNCFYHKINSVEIECVPIENCTFATKLLTKSERAMEVLNFLNYSRCGVDENQNTIKIWCNKFVNCMTPDNRYGTCIQVKNCAAYMKLLENSNRDIKTKEFLKQFRCDLPNESEIHVCCPKIQKLVMKSRFGDGEYSSDQRVIAWNQETKRQNRRQAANPFWSPGQNYDFLKPNNGFLGQNPGFNVQNLDFNIKKMQNSLGSSILHLQSSLAQENDRFKNALLNSSGNGIIGNQDGDNAFGNWLKTNYVNKSKGFNSENNYELREETFDSKIEECLTPDDTQGTCKGIKDCSSVINLLRTLDRGNSSNVQYLQKFRCSFTDDTPLKVCCPEQTIQNDVKPKIDFGEENIKIEKDNTSLNDNSDNNLSSVSSICGRQTTDNKILGGTTTDLAEYPWTAILQYTTNKGLIYGCGGSLISNRYVLTAAHCLHKDILKQVGLNGLYRVVLGEYDTRNKTDCFYFKYGTECADDPQYLGVEDIIFHELFESKSTTNDIALIKLDKNVIFSDYVRPICLPSRDLGINLKGNEKLVIAGWGKTESGQLSPEKRKATIIFVSKEKCNLLGPLNEGQICLGNGSGIDSCKGDSGGPVMHTVVKSGEYLTALVGIISYGFGACGNRPSVSTYVSFYMDWITKNVK